MTREEVKETLGSEARAFYKSPDSLFPTDAFDSLHLHVCYAPTGIVEAVEIFPPAIAIFEGRTLLDEPFNEVKDWFVKIDNETELESTGLTSRKFGISIYAPFALSNPEDPVESVLVFNKGYYD